MADYFKGYIPTVNKQCKKGFAFKDKSSKDLLTLEQAQKLPEYAGVLADGIMFVDIDNFEQSEILFRMVKDLGIACTVLKTSRGKHFYFKNPDVTQNFNGITLAIGLTADIKIGKKASYGVLRVDGQDREILLDCKEPQDLPKWLIPIKRADVGFLDMAEGDGRNQALFNYILTLQTADFSKRSARECIRLINSHVLKVPLSDTELDVILRDEAFNKDIFFNKDGGFLFDKFAIALKNNANVIKINEQLHIYQGGIYVSGKRKIEHEMLKMYPQMNRTKRNEVFDYLDIICVQMESHQKDSNLIAFRNGVYDILTDQLLPFSPDYIITNRIDWDYNPHAKSEIVDEVLNNISCHDPKIRALLEEIVGYCFYRRNELGKAFILTGDKSNGKSTYLDMVKTVLGESNIAALDLADLSKRFLTAEIFGKLANIGDDIGDEFIPNTSVFKKLVTGEGIDGIERKGQDPFKLYSYAKLLFSANNIPRLGKGKDSAAIKRRLIIVPFDARFSTDDPNFKPYIKYELRKQDAMEYLIVLAVAGLKRVTSTNVFTESVKVKKSIEEYEEINNPTIGFFRELEAEGLKIENEPTADIYKAYAEFCIREGLQALSNNVFSKEINKRYGFISGYKRISGKVHRIFQKPKGEK